MDRVVFAIIGLVTGALLAFGGVLAIFDWAHQGTNTRPWQAFVGWVLPPAVVVTTLVRQRGSAERRKQLRAFLLTFALASVVAFLVLWLLLQAS